MTVSPADAATATAPPPVTGRRPVHRPLRGVRLAMMTLCAGLLTLPVMLPAYALAQPKKLVAPDSEPPRQEDPRQEDKDESRSEGQTFGGLPGEQGRGVSANRLEAGSGLAVGTVSVQDRQLGLDLWRGSARVTLETLISRLPAGVPSPAMTDLTKRLLLTTARPPSGPGSDRPFLAARTEALYSLGFLDDAISLAGQAPRGRGPEALAVAATRAKAELLKGQSAQACRQLDVAEDAATQFWLKLRALCYLQNGAEPAALLARDLMLDQGVEAPLFFALIDQVTGFGEAPGEALYRRGLGPVELSLHNMTAADLPPAAYDSAEAPVRKALAQALLEAEGRLPEVHELAAAEQMAAADVMPLSALRALYRRLDFTAAQMGDPVTAAADLPGPMGRALMYQALLRATSDQESARLVSSGLVLATENAPGTALLVARLTADTSQRIRPTEPLVYAALDVSQSALAGGHVTAAQDWLALLQPDPEPQEESYRNGPWGTAAAPSGFPSGNAPTGGVAPNRLTGTALGQEAAPAAYGSAQEPSQEPSQEASANRPYDPFASAPPAPYTPPDEATLTARGLRALLTVSAPSERLPFSAGDQGATWQTYAERGAADPDRIAREILFLEALAFPVTEDQSRWARDSLRRGWRVEPVIIRALRTASANGRVGETVARSLVLIGEAGPAGQHPLTLAEAIHALTQVGLAADARALAFEHLVHVPAGD